ncbi:MAG: DUF4363 family protein [Oscillospiraceae bacterium]
MKRVIFCIVILAAIISFSAYSLYSLNFHCSELSADVTEISLLSEKNDKKQALEKTQELVKSWENDYKFFSMMVRHEKLFEINASIAKIRSMIIAENDELLSELDTILYSLDLLKKSEFPYLHNIF